MHLPSHIESILFVASKPLTMSHLAKTLGVDMSLVSDAIETLMLLYNRDDRGIHILREGETVQMATKPEHAEMVEHFLTVDISGELTKAQLETLTVIAYRSPVTRADVEQIRGVNCAVILRNLMMRGLIEESHRQEDILPTYTLTTQALAALGIPETKMLPDYERLSTHTHVEHALNADE